MHVLTRCLWQIAQWAGTASRCRDVLIKLFEEPIPESYKAGRKVMEAVPGSPLTDKPVLCFSSNLALAALVKPGMTPCVWESKARTELGMETVLKTIDTAGQ
jgi:hypothetical protein